MSERASREPQRRRPKEAAASARKRERVDPIGWLQQTAGNAAVGELLGRLAEGEVGQPVAPKVAQPGPWMGGTGSVQRVVAVPAAGTTVQRAGGAAAKIKHATGKEVDDFLIASTFLKPYVESKMKGGTKAETAVKLHNAEDFKKEWVAYAMARSNPDTGKTFTKAEAEAWEANVNAFQGDGAIHVHEGRGERATTIHESMHLFADDSFVSTVGFNTNEGTTEYFTRVVTTEQKITRGTFYPSQYASVSKLVGVSSKDKLADAYFNNKLDDIKKDAEDKAAGTWDKWLGHMKGGQYAKADELLK